jgi:hypothetical protein
VPDRVADDPVVFPSLNVDAVYRVRQKGVVGQDDPDVVAGDRVTRQKGVIRPDDQPSLARGSGGGVAKSLFWTPPGAVELAVDHLEGRAVHGKVEALAGGGGDHTAGDRQGTARLDRDAKLPVIGTVHRQRDVRKRQTARR